MQIDCGFPGGNVLVEKIEGDTAFIRQDLRDTEGDWFYFSFRARGAAGRKVTFQFTGSNVIGPRGPACSVDGQKTWRWLGMEAVREKSFTFQFPAGANEVFFAHGIPYLESHLNEFLARHRGNPALETGTLCRTRKGRNVERLNAGRLDGKCAYRVLAAARHHCCEAMASYVLEGMLEGVLAEDETGRWMREHVELLALPFMDKDGVEDGDQGKNRKPHDHNRDYTGESIHAEVRALRALVPEWSGGRLRAAFDFHCPWIRGKHNEDFYFVGSKDPGNWERMQEFSRLLEAELSGGLPFESKHDLPYGQAWNTYEGPLVSFGRWACGLPGLWLSASTETPYSNCGGVETSPERARTLGRDFARALRKFLEKR